MNEVCWDDRTEWTTVPCIGGPLDGEARDMPLGARTVFAPQWNGAYYEIMRYRGGYALIWQGGGHRFAHHIAARAGEGR